MNSVVPRDSYDDGAIPDAPEASANGISGKIVSDGVVSARSTLSGCWSKNQEHKRQGNDIFNGVIKLLRFLELFF